MTHILVIGGAHIDRRARITGRTIGGASNPGLWHEEPGGGGFNAARNLTQLNNAVTMVSVRGGDAAGQLVEQAAEEAGIEDLAQVFLDRATPSYSAVLENNGDLVIAIADMDLYDRFVDRQLARKSIREAIGKCDAVLCDANLPADTLTALALMVKDRLTPISAIAISPAKVVKLAGTFEHLSILFLNQAEAMALCGGEMSCAHWPALLRASGIGRAVITRGAEPVLCFDNNTCFEIAPPKLDQIMDVTGAGDALAAATIHALLAGQTFSNAVRNGIAASHLTIQSPHAASPQLDTQTLTNALSLVPEPVYLP